MSLVTKATSSDCSFCRHAAGLPVRGQNTQTNARTARKLNKVDRRTFST